jgi:ATP-binding cassette subfamily B protein
MPETSSRRLSGIRQVYGLLARSRRLLVLAVAGAVLQAASLIPMPLILRQVFATQIPHHDKSGIVLSGVELVALYVLSAAFALGTASFANQAVKRTIVQLRHDLLQKLYALPQAWHDAQSSGLVQSLIVLDTERVDQMLIVLTVLIIPAVLVTVVLAAVGLAIDAVLFAILVVVLLILVAGGQLLARRLRRFSHRWMESAAAFSSDMSQMLRAMTLTKVAGAERSALARHRLRLEELAETGRAYAVANSAYAGVQASIAAIAGVVVLVIGGIGVADGSIRLADLLSFYAILGLMVRQFAAMGPATPVALNGLISLSRLNEVLDSPEREPYQGTARLDFTGEFEFESVTFAYATEPVLEEVDLRVSSGERVAIMGPNGAGKSTLVALLLGLYRPGSGRVLADGVPFEDLDLSALRHDIGVVLQDTVLFRGTLRENIASGRPAADDEAIAMAAQLAGATEFIDRLPEGYLTLVGDEGTGLSGGQRQRLALARALVAKPRLLLLDEPTTFLDEQAVSAVLKNLRALPSSPTIVIVTHDAGAARLAERVVHLRRGRVSRITERATAEVGRG